jgi:hypothetical protein
MKNTDEVENEGSVDAKPWWMSRTIIGIAAMLLSQGLKALKWEVLPGELTDLLTMALDLGGAALAVYGRVKARKDLTLTKPGGVFNPRAEVRRAEAVRGPGAGGRRGGNPKNGSALTRVLFFIGLALLALFTFLPFVGCASVQTARGQRQQWQVTVGTPVEKTGRSVVRFGTGVAIVSGASVFFLPLGFVVGVPCYVVGGPMWETGAWMTGNTTDWSYGGL